MLHQLQSLPVGGAGAGQRDPGGVGGHAAILQRDIPENFPAREGLGQLLKIGEGDDFSPQVQPGISLLPEASGHIGILGEQNHAQPGNDQCQHRNQHRQHQQSRLLFSLCQRATLPSGVQNNHQIGEGRFISALLSLSL